MSEDIRWKQRFSNFERALKRLTEAVQLSQQRELSNLEQQGMIQAFEFTHELAWKVLKDYLQYQGIMGIVGSRDAVREGFEKGLISDGTIWMEMIKSRNASSHTYNESTAEEIVSRIVTDYHNQFIDLVKKLKFL
ncbi:nucleotidyltransferase substrate binding protein [Marinoscillum furvescens]|uniref:Nucleotidyltransferase substrate binding protein (TIGR01987 family) n=1 Tax=Marinoscillum furvescens DSM 4134 TaxID=1122208 RepID=A0A3D9L2U1_MARFU|nr:nucleotidyltransferase substrate binding protein [Marinoscillum furvescens]RED98945.1 nucleotidyltransferase substrate binding protein (TIGR01987 family) [Marinoscillum furvescens DSM 4134]